MTDTAKTRIAVVLYPGVTSLDFVGPSEVLGGLPGVVIRFLSTQPGQIRSDTGGLTLLAGDLAELPDPDIFLVPGGPGVEAAMRDETLLAWIRRAHETSKWSTSVCNGSRILAAAGILDGLKATCHWAQLEELRNFGAIPTSERVVREGKVITAAGVSAGIDMALRLVALEAGDMMAQAIQLAIEYDPDPPFDCGSVKKAPKPLTDMVLAFFAQRQAALAKP
jgi:transcriptional regulator GlxA family with amidase domain